MKSCEIFLFILLLKCKDITTNAEEVTCHEQDLNNVHILMGHPGINPPYTSGHVLVFKCIDVNMMMYGQRAIECRSDGNWDNPFPQCGVKAFCTKPLLTLTNSRLIDERTYSHRDTVRYECDDGYESIGETIAKCDGQTWIYPECIRKAQCTKPTKNLQYVTLSDEKNLFNNFETLRYKCNKPYDKIPGGSLTCRDEKWIGTIGCTSSICPPPPEIENGDFITKDMTSEVIMEVTYSCQSYYVLNEQRKHYRCRDGRWETPPKCLKPCKLTPEIYTDSNIQPIRDNYVKHSDGEISFKCNEGWNSGGVRKSDYAKGTCSEGNINIHKKCHTENIFG
ncbi:complement factor H-like [Triplophysa dalaica]|uniref:complement factor H-like n=1 Tax=Triplophysa dalaica TaxID=1582913 RepID=UPI0024E01A15|nr:complement factor H-like [Triplophysa dalaica]